MLCSPWQGYGGGQKFPTAMTLLHSIASDSLWLEAIVVLMHPANDVIQALVGRSSLFRDSESSGTYSVGRRLCRHGKCQMRCVLCHSQISRQKLTDLHCRLIIQTAK